MTDRPNIVLVSIDSLRADHCGFAGYDRDTTPALDSMAEEGLTFERAIAPGPATPESMPVIFTGQFPVDGETRATSELGARRERIRRHMMARESLAERLSRRGYTTAAFTPNPFTSRHFGFDAGFDHFQDFMGASRSRGDLYERIFQGFLDGDASSSVARMLFNIWQREEVFKPWQTFYDEAVGWANQVDGPYFLWVFLMDAHNPYMTGRGYRTQARWKTFHANYRFWRESHETPFSPKIHDRLVTAYDDSIRYSDAFLGRLREDLAGDDPLIVVHGDHGEAFGEHGTYGHEPYLYPENLHVPLIVDGGERDRIGDPVSLRSMPALLDELATGGSGRAIADRPYVVSRTRQGNKTGVHGRNWGYIYDHSTDESEFVSDDGTTTADEPLSEHLGRVVADWTEVETEQARIAAAAGATSGETL